MRPVRSHVHERSFQISRNDDDLSLISLPHFRESVHLILKLERTFHNRFDIKLAYVIVKSEEISERSIRKQGVKNATFCETSANYGYWFGGIDCLYWSRCCTRCSRFLDRKRKRLNYSNY